MNDHTQKAAARFNKWADSYGEDRIAPWFRHYQRFVISRLNITPGDAFLDVGCGTGWAVIEAAQQLKAGKACGMDISPKMIDKARLQSIEMPDIEFCVANAEVIPYPDETFDCIMCTCSFHHYLHPRIALEEFRRVMKAGGRLALLDSARNVSFPIWMQDRWRRYLEKSHVRYYTTAEMKTMVEASGLHLNREIETINRFMFQGKVFTGLMLSECVR